MTPTQVFNWFCKEHNVMANIMMIYHVSHPRCNVYTDGKIETKYLTYDEFIENKLKNGNFADLFMNVQNAYLYTIGWQKYDEYSKRIGLEGLNRKWRYFAKNNIFIDDDCVKVGDDIDFTVSAWRRWNNADAFLDDEVHKGRVDSINIGDSTITIYDYVDNQYRTYYANEFLDKNTKVFNFDLKFYIKRNRRKYYGRNHGK